MPVKIEFTTEQLMRQTPLPQHGKSYTVISHGDVIDQTRSQLSAAGFNITNELYKTNLNGEVAQGIYHLDYGNDPDMTLMFGWSNSYNKTMAFKCAIGSQVRVCMNGMVAGDLAKYRKKHRGSQALSEVIATIDYQISHAKEYYEQLVKDKEMLKKVILSPVEKANIIGQLFVSQVILTLSQLGVVKREMDNPSHIYGSKDSAWDLYNHVTFSLKDSHPMSYLDDHQKVHKFFIDAYGGLVTPQVTAPIIVPNYETINIKEHAHDPGVIFL